MATIQQLNNYLKQRFIISSIPTFKSRFNLTIKFIAFFTLLMLLPITSCKTGKGEENQTNQKGTEDQQFKSIFHDAIAEKMIGHYDKAIELFEKCIVLKADNSAVYFALSDLYELQGNKSKALQLAEKAYQLDEQNKWYAMRLADLYFGLGDYKKSADYFHIAIDENEQNLELKFKYAEALIYSNQYAKAIEVMNQIEIETGKLPELSLTKHDMYLSLGDVAKAQDELTSLIASNPKNMAYRMVVAEYFLNTNQIEKAKKIIDEALAIQPNLGEAYVLLADIDLRNNNIANALKNLEKAFAQDDLLLERKLELIWGLAPYAFEIGNPEAKKFEAGLEKLFQLVYDPTLKSEMLHSYYGTFLKNQNKKTEAYEQFKLVCNLSASDYSSWDHLLNIEYELKFYKEMFEDGKKALELFPAQPMFYLLTGIGAYESKQYSEAEEYLFLGKDLVVQDDELLAEFYYHLGKTYCLQKNYSEGYSYLEQAKKKYPATAKYYGVKAKYLYEEGKIADAENEIKQGLSIEPNNAVILHIQGTIFLSKKDYQAALIALEKAAINDYTNGYILESYGDALFLSNNKEKAVQLWIEAEKNGNQSELLKRKIADKTYYEN